MPEKISIRIDGEYVAGHRGPDHPGSRPRQRQIHPHALLPGRPQRRGRLPPVHRGGLRRGPPAARLHHSGAGRHVRHHQLRKADRATAAWPSSSSSPSAITTAPCASPTATASCRPWPSGWASLTCAIRTATRGCRWISRTSAIVLDHNRCILCTRCVRVCAEVEGAHVWDIGCARHSHP